MDSSTEQGTHWITPREATQAIAQGSWAVLLFMVLCTLFFKKHALRWMSQQISTMQATAEAVRYNSTSLRTSESHLEKLAENAEMSERMGQFVAKKVVSIAEQTDQIAKDIKAVRDLLEK